jgi:hypothetical protein
MTEPLRRTGQQRLPLDAEGRGAGVVELSTLLQAPLKIPVVLRTPFATLLHLARGTLVNGPPGEFVDLCAGHCLS